MHKAALGGGCHAQLGVGAVHLNVRLALRRPTPISQCSHLARQAQPQQRRLCLRTACSTAPPGGDGDKFAPQVCVVLGTQWGDEGKGKLVDILARGYDIVARAQV